MVKGVFGFLFCCAMLVGSAQAVVVTGRVQIEGPFDGGFPPRDHYRLRHLYSSGSDSLTLSAVDFNTFKIEAVTFGTGFEAFVLSAGDEFTAQYADSHPYLATNWGAPYGIGNIIDVPIGGIYIGFYVPFQSPGPEVEQISWAKIMIVSGQPVVADGATSINGGGIIVGTTTEIPEPASALLLSCASLLILRRRR